MVFNKIYNLYSPAKVNFYLKVIKKLLNGYHEIESFVSQINIIDHIKISEVKTNKTTVKFIGKFSQSINNSSNSITRIIYFLKKQYPSLKNKNFRVIVYKHIPAGSGLGGGSSNAMTIFKFLKKKFNLKVTKKNLFNICNFIGSDSRIFIDKYPKFVYGIGDKVSVIKKKIKLNLLLIYPNKPNLTVNIYKSNKVYSCIGNNLSAKKKINKNIFNLFDFNNDLLDAAKKSNPAMRELINFLGKQKICDRVQMSGSGSCCYVICRSKKNLLKCEKLVKTKYRSYWTAVTKTIT